MSDCLSPKRTDPCFCFLSDTHHRVETLGDGDREAKTGYQRTRLPRGEEHRNSGQAQTGQIT